MRRAPWPGALEPGQLFADFNTAAPGRKLEVAGVIEPTGAAFADVALLQSVPGRGLRTPALASGPGAEAFAELFGAWGMPVAVGPDGPGFAASRKLVRSVFLKGLAAAASRRWPPARRWMRGVAPRRPRALLDGGGRRQVDRLVAGAAARGPPPRRWRRRWRCS